LELIKQRRAWLQAFNLQALTITTGPSVGLEIVHIVRAYPNL
jgi:hypothetical protein